MTGLRQQLLDWILVAGWMGVIFWLSATPDLRSGLDSEWDLVLRKIAHALEYVVLAWLLCRALLRSGVRRRRVMVVALLMCLAYAGSDEWHQTFVQGRHGSSVDTLVDGFGGLLGISLYFRRR